MLCRILSFCNAVLVLYLCSSASAKHSDIVWKKRSRSIGFVTNAFISLSSKGSTHLPVKDIASSLLFRDVSENIQLDFKRAYQTWLNGNAEKSMFKSNKRSRREIPGIELRQKKLAIFNEQRGLLSSAEQEGIDIADERNVMVL